MKISVITTVFNGVRTLEQTIQSVLDQTHDDIEHIIIDGGSTDGSLDIINRYKKHLAYFVSEPDAGIYHGMNKGIERATGDVIGFINSDDFYANENVLSDVEKVLSDLSIDGCYANLLYVDFDNTDKIVRYWSSRKYKEGLFERGWIPAHPTFYVRTSVYRNLGGFDTSLRYQSDLEHIARFMAVNKISTRFVPDIWVHMRMGGATNRSIKNILQGNLESYRALKKLGLKLTPFYFLTKFLMRIPQFFKRPKKG